MSLIGTAMGVAALIITVSVLNGLGKEITSRVVSLSSHIQITSLRSEGVKDYQKVIAHLTDTSIHLGLKSVHPYIQHEAVLKFKDKTEGIILKGVRDEDSIFTTQRKIISGSSILTSSDTMVMPILIGNKLASKLGVTVDSKVFIIASNGIPSAMNPPEVKAFKVVGIYESGLKDYDDVLLYANLSVSQKLFEMGGNITGLEVMVKNADDIEETATRIRKVISYPFHTMTIFQIYSGLFAWVDLQKKDIPIVLGLIAIVAAFNIIVFLLMIVLEKTEEIGILVSLGSSSLDIIKIFFYQGLAITITGIVIGNILGYGLCFIQQHFNIINLPLDIYHVSGVPLDIRWSSGLLITGIAVIMNIIVTIVPSFLASKLNPLTSLRFK